MIGRFLIWLSLLAMAVAAGIAVGAQYLSDDVAEPATSAPAEPELVVDEFSNTLATTALRQANGQLLEGSGVVILTLPGADPATVESVTAALTMAADTVTATAQVGTKLTDPSLKMLAESLGEQLADEIDDDTETTGYERIGHLLGVALTTAKPKPQPVGEQPRLARQSLTTAEYLTGVRLGAQRAPGVVLITGDDVDPAIMTGLLTGLAPVARGVVLAGPTGDSTVEAVREANTGVSTFDGAETEAGAQAVVSTLIAELFNQGGDFGASGADGSVPIG